MTGQTPIYQYPYLTGTDNGKQIKAVSKALAERIEATMQNQGMPPLDSDLVALLTRLEAAEAALSDITPRVADTGWVPITAAGPGWNLNNTFPNQIRRVGKRVDLVATVDWTSTGGYTNMLTVPAGFRLPAGKDADPVGYVFTNNGIGLKLSLSATTHVLSATTHIGSGNPARVPLIATWYSA